MTSPLTQLPVLQKMGSQSLFSLPIKIKVADDSFLHIGGTPSPLTDKKLPVFSVDGEPVIPATSFKGALRHQIEQLLIERKTSLAQSLNLPSDRVGTLKPSIPASRATRAEQDLLAKGYRGQSEIKIEERGVNAGEGLCPVSYFLGANGLEGFIRVPNFFPSAGEWRIDQTRIRIDRQTKTAASGAIVTGEQVKPGTVFNGNLLLFQERQGAVFGRPRVLGGTTLDLWLASWAEKDDAKRQLFLFNEILLPALNNLKFLGGQKSIGGGMVDVSLATN